VDERSLILIGSMHRSSVTVTDGCGITQHLANEQMQKKHLSNSNGTHHASMATTTTAAAASVHSEPCTPRSCLRLQSAACLQQRLTTLDFNQGMLVRNRYCHSTSCYM
jgi:hypothetical protein